MKDSNLQSPQCPPRMMDVKVRQDYDAGEEWCKRLLSKSGFSSIYLDYRCPNKLKSMDSELSILHYENLLEVGCLETGFSRDSLDSFFRNMYVRFIKRQSPHARSKLKSLVESIALSSDVGKGSKSILQMAISIQYSPYLLARMIVESFVATVEGIGNRKAGISTIMRNPDVLLTPENITLQTTEHILGENNSNSLQSKEILLAELQRIVRDAVLIDTLSGPRHELSRRELGLKYEQKLEQILRQVGIPFDSEEDLRQRGTSKTPDVLLRCPIGIKVSRTSNTRFNNKIKWNDDWRVVCWIDSKALYGDIHTHNDDVLSQAESYLHRFGPGMVLYWFGHAPLERLDTCQGDITILDSFPKEVMLPTGEYLQYNGETE